MAPDVPIQWPLHWLALIPVLAALRSRSILQIPRLAVDEWGVETSLHRKLKEEGLDLSTKRVLQVLTDAKGARFKYEKVGHGWVQKLIQRPSVPSVNAKKLVEDLNADYEGSNWKEGGEGLVAICQSINITSTPVHELAEYLAKHDDGL